jgi:excisionase family DNA binding protein
VDGSLTLADVAAELNVSLKTARRLVIAGKLRAFKVGRVWRVRRGDLSAFVAAQLHEARLAQTPRSGRASARSVRHLEGWDTFH